MEKTTNSQAPRLRRAVIIDAKPTYQSLVNSPVDIAAKMQALQDEEKVTVIVPVAFTLTLDGHIDKHFKPGVQEMPKSLTEHWFVKSRGVTTYNPNHSPN